jgi:hypothetical protein
MLKEKQVRHIEVLFAANDSRIASINAELARMQARTAELEAERAELADNATYYHAKFDKDVDEHKKIKGQ